MLELAQAEFFHQGRDVDAKAPTQALLEAIPATHWIGFGTAPAFNSAVLGGLLLVGSAELKKEAVDQLVQVGDIVAKYGDDRVKIEGHTDATGGTEFNQKLSERRADAVKTVLVARGVKPEQISAIGYGETKPVAPNDTAENKAKNRRVELHIDVPNPT